jgi:phage repressor protein C with HTH and peptisase S24 domain
MKIINRIAQYIDTEGISKNAFDKIIGAGNGYIGKQITNDASIGGDVIEKIICNFPKLNPIWLITGEGEMLKSAQNKSKPLPVARGIPLIPIEAIAGKGVGELVIKEGDIEERYVVPEFEKADYLIRVKGSSMYPKYSSGDIVACVRCDKNSFIQWNKTYVVDTSQGAMIKRIVKGSNKNEWILRSDNKDFQDIDIDPDKDIFSIALVIGVIRFE